MIARMWHGVTRADRADEYSAFLRDRALPDYRGVPGNLAAYILRRIEGGQAHFLTLTFWTSRQAIQAFAGPAIERARYYPEDSDFLLAFEPTVLHYDVVASQDGGIDSGIPPG
jgi:heme-degrading monooxygenase HmoA